MALKIRIEYAGAACHVMARGNQGREICDDDCNRKRWLETLGEACAKTGWCIHARSESDAGHWPGEARGVAATGAAEKTAGSRSMKAIMEKWRDEVCSGFWSCFLLECLLGLRKSHGREQTSRTKTERPPADSPPD